jgi:GT2 family glycosyltransferase
VLQSIAGIDAEIIVVDNASADESASMVASTFPTVKLIANKSNQGFSKGNNTGVKEASGKNILILNPDTVINPAAIQACLQALNDHPDAGAVGVKMINSKGEYLKESKRGFPDLPASLFKLTGLNKIFPHHARINRYYLGQLDQNTICEVEILTGAFLMMPRALYASLNGFDERFFMYGEDIDLSYRIRTSGKKLIYLGNQHIIHLKGRSSNGISYEHVHNFYSAMAVFVSKFQPNQVLKHVLLAGIKCTAVLSWMKRQVVNHFLPITDLLIIVSSLAIVQLLWSTFWFHDPSYFHHREFLFNAVTYIMIWMASLFLFNSYHPLNQNKIQHALQGVIAGTFAILILYSLLPDYMRTSRAIIVFSGGLIAFILPGLRRMLSPEGNGYRGLFLGTSWEEKNHHELFSNLAYYDFFSYLNRMEWSKGSQNVTELKNIVQNQQITHMILDKNRVSREEILDLSAQCRSTSLLYVQDKNDLTTLYNSIPGMAPADIRLNQMPYRIIKRVINLVAVILILPWGWIRKDIRSVFFALMTGRVQLVGYRPPVYQGMPPISPGLWPPSLAPLPNDNVMDINFEYAQHYTPALDIKIILNHLFSVNY